MEDVIDSPEGLYKYLRKSNTKLLANIMFAGSPGHQIAELDYFLRKFRCGEIPRDGRYLWIQKAGLITSALAEIFGPHFRQYNLGMIALDNYFDMASEICRMMPELGIDVGISHLKNSVMSRDNTFISRFSDKLYYNVTNDAVMRATIDYARTRRLTEDFDPWRPGLPPIEGELADLLGGKIGRIAAIHFRKNPGNAGVRVPPEHFFPTLEYLRDNGYTLVKVGTEPYPEEFAAYDVINYTGSPLRSFRNDFILLGNSKLHLINASGLEHIGDVLDIPIVSYGRWHLSLVPYARKMVVVPALLYDPKRERLLSFGEQMLFFRTRPEWWEGQFFGWHFPIDRFAARPPQADELLAATKEAIALGEVDQPLTAEQTRFIQLDDNGLLPVARGRVSQFFLERCQSLL